MNSDSRAGAISEKLPARCTTWRLASSSGVGEAESQANPVATSSGDNISSGVTPYVVSSTRVTTSWVTTVSALTAKSMRAKYAAREAGSVNVAATTAACW